MTRTNFLAAAISALVLAGTSAAGPGPKYLITFGDSYSQTGFQSSGAKATAANPLGNPALPGWTASGGLNWVGHMVSELNTSLTLSYNFAYGGATVDADLVTPYASTVQSMADQVDDFENSGLADKPDWAPWSSWNTVVGVWMGVNDVGNSWWLSGQEERIDAIMERLDGLLGRIYDAGARKFVVLGVPPITKTPLMLSQDQYARDTEGAMITAFNAALQETLESFKQDHSGIKAAFVDTFPAFNEAIDNPTEYGAPDATCYNQDGTSCLWFNDYHPGIAINRLVAEDFAAAARDMRW